MYFLYNFLFTVYTINNRHVKLQNIPVQTVHVLCIWANRILYLSITMHWHIWKNLIMLTSPEIKRNGRPSPVILRCVWPRGLYWPLLQLCLKLHVVPNTHGLGCSKCNIVELKVSSSSLRKAILNLVAVA